MPKLGLVKIILHRNIPADWVLKHVTITERAGGKFYASLTFEAVQEEVKPAAAFHKIESFDCSMPNVAVSASGRYDVKGEEVHWYRLMEQKLAKEQRRLSRMEYGSHNYWKQRHRIGAIHEKIADRRRDYLHKLSAEVASEFDAVVVEDLNLHAMAQALNFGKSVNDNGFGMFRVFPAYKLKAQGKVLVKADRYFAGSQRCSICHHINPEVKDLAVREWACPVCGARHSRDKNACENLKQEGTAMLNRWTGGDSALILAPTGVLSAKKPHLLQGGE